MIRYQENRQTIGDFLLNSSVLKYSFLVISSTVKTIIMAIQNKITKVPRV